MRDNLQLIVLYKCDLSCI